MLFVRAASSPLPTLPLLPLLKLALSLEGGKYGLTVGTIVVDLIRHRPVFEASILFWCASLEPMCTACAASVSAPLVRSVVSVCGGVMHHVTHQLGTHVFACPTANCHSHVHCQVRERIRVHAREGCGRPQHAVDLSKCSDVLCGVSAACRWHLELWWQCLAVSSPHSITTMHRMCCCMPPST